MTGLKFKFATRGNDIQRTAAANHADVQRGVRSRVVSVAGPLSCDTLLPDANPANQIARHIDRVDAALRISRMGGAPAASHSQCHFALVSHCGTQHCRLTDYAEFGAMAPA